MTRNAALYKKLGDWFLERPNDLIPKAGMDCTDEEIMEYQIFFDPTERMDLEGFDLQGNASRDQYETANANMNDLPLLVAIQAGVDSAQLVSIAKHHQVDVKNLFHTLDEMLGFHYDLVMRDGKPINQSDLYVQCVKVISQVFPEELLEMINTKDEFCRIHKACIHSENPIHWPVTRLAAIMEKMKQVTAQEDEFFSEDTFSFNGSLSSDEFQIRDATGIRYDLFLERSGMLLPEVASKKIGPIALWENMLDVAKDEEDTGMGGLFKYCINNPQEHLRPGIYRGLSGMALASSIYMHDGYGLYKALDSQVAGSWLEPISQNLPLIISLMGTDNQFTPRNLAIALQERLCIENHGVPVKVQHKTLLEHCLQAILDVPVEELGVSHFQIYLLGTAEMPEPEFSAGFRPEPIIVHMLKGLEHLSLPESDTLRAPVIDEFMAMGCTFVTKTLAKHFHLDYQAFSGIGSKGVRVLAEAGLDKRRLPRMNVRDRGHVVSQELGL